MNFEKHGKKMPPPPRSKRFRQSKSRSRGSSAKRIPLPTKKGAPPASTSYEKSAHQSKKPGSPTNITSSSILQDRSKPGTSSSYTAPPDVSATTVESGVQLLAQKVTSSAIQKAEIAIVESICAKMATITNKAESSMPSTQDKMDTLLNLFDKMTVQLGRTVETPVNHIQITNSKNESQTKTLDEAKVLPDPVSTNKHSKEEGENMTVEEKQALRKAKKDAKKTGKADSPIENAVPISTGAVGKEEKSKAQLKQERRMKQEAQRSAKDTAKLKPEPQKEIAPKAVQKKEIKQKKVKQVPLIAKQDVPSYLNHLPKPYSCFQIASQDIHTAIITVARGMQSEQIEGTTTRVVSLLVAFQQLLSDYSTPLDKVPSKDLVLKIDANIQYINSLRPVISPINNFLNCLKTHIKGLAADLPEKKVKESIANLIQLYREKMIDAATVTAATSAETMITDGDTILTFGFSGILLKAVSMCAETGKSLTVIVMDTPRSSAGQRMCDKIKQIGHVARCMAVQDLGSAFKSFDMMIIEPDTVYLNGSLLGRCGLAECIFLAKTNSKMPVYALTQHFKSVQHDVRSGFEFNELCDTKPMTQNLSGWQSHDKLQVVKLKYDLIPCGQVDTVITENTVFFPGPTVVYYPQEDT